MEPENFERSLRAFTKRRPFESFFVGFADGGGVTVDHPEALVVRGGVAVHISLNSEPTPFDHRNVSQRTAAIERGTA